MNTLPNLRLINLSLSPTSSSSFSIHCGLFGHVHIQQDSFPRPSTIARKKIAVTSASVELPIRIFRSSLVFRAHASSTSSTSVAVLLGSLDTHERFLVKLPPAMIASATQDCAHHHYEFQHGAGKLRQQMLPFDANARNSMPIFARILFVPHYSRYPSAVFFLTSFHRNHFLCSSNFDAVKLFCGLNRASFIPQIFRSNLFLHHLRVYPRQSCFISRSAPGNGAVRFALVALLPCVKGKSSFIQVRNVHIVSRLLLEHHFS